MTTHMSCVIAPCIMFAGEESVKNRLVFSELYLIEHNNSAITPPQM